MVRMSKAKQDKLESIMHLVEQLGIDRVLGRLRQTKMMSKDVLDDMKEWETDYEKRVALLGFLVSPEGKRAFGALYELSKVHEEQLKLQEEQEKLRQEQLAQQPNADLRKFGGRGKGPNVNANMKLKLRQQLAKRREAPQPAANQKPGEQPPGPPQPQTQQIPIPAPPTSKSGKRSPSGAAAKKGGSKEAADEKPTENGDGQNPEKPDDQRANEKPPKEPKPPSPIGGTPARSRANSETPTTVNKAPGQDNGLDLSLTGSAVSAPVPASTVVLSPARPARTRTSSVGSMSPGPMQAKSLEDFSHAKARETAGETEIQTDGQWGRSDSAEAEGSEDEGAPSVIIEGDRPPPDGENPEDEREIEATAEGTKKVRISNTVKVVEVRDSAPNSPSTTASTPVVKRRKLCDVHQKLLNGEISVDKLTMDQIREIVAEWQIMKKDHGNDGEYMLKELQHAKDDLKRMSEEKDRIRKEKDKYVFKEFELQQKLQDLSQKHKSLRDDHESLKQGNYQIQQNTKKNNKIHQEMRKKIAKLESKIKSMDKVTVRKGTQTTEVFDKDVHEALRVAEESLQVVQSELKDALAKSKTAQQEAEDLKKQLNAKGREINKRERKSKKDEESIRLVTRERDAMETKLKKVTEQLEYYKGMLEIRAKGGKRQVPEKKEVRVQRCSSGRHVVLKTHVAGNEDCKSQGRQESEDTRNGANRNGRNSLTNGTSSSRQTRPAQGKTTSQSTSSKAASESSSSQNRPAQKPSNGGQPSTTKSPSNTTSNTSTKPPPANTTKTQSITTSTTNKSTTSNTTSTTKTPPSNTAKNSETRTPQSKPVVPAKDQTDTGKQDHSTAGSKQPTGSDSPSTASKQKHVSFSTSNSTSQKQPVGSNSPNPGQRQQSGHDEKPARPKAATVRPANNPTQQKK